MSDTSSHADWKPGEYRPQADGPEPVTLDWLYSVGFEDTVFEGETADGNVSLGDSERNVPELCRYSEFHWTFCDGYSGSTNIPAPRTRDELWRLAAALGFTLTE
jgi:hypothetical protein